MSAVRMRGVAVERLAGARRLLAVTAGVVALVGPASTTMAQTQVITTRAGTGVAGFNGDAIAASVAQLSVPADVQTMADGGYLITDQGNQRVRRVGPDGTIRR